jgi:hypothetical protein
MKKKLFAIAFIRCFVFLSVTLFTVACNGDGATSANSDLEVAFLESSRPSGLYAEVNIYEQNIKLSWNQSSKTNDFVVHLATESLSGKSLLEISQLADYQSYTVIGENSITLEQLSTEKPYYFIVTALIDSQESTPSYQIREKLSEIKVSAPNRLNDTGIQFGGNFPLGNDNKCSGEVIASQDCSHGRDALAATGRLTKVGGGRAGFDFTKLDMNGNPLPADAPEWACVRDNVTQLVWEVKQGGNWIIGDEGLHDADDFFAWYDTDDSRNGGERGDVNADVGLCYGYLAGEQDSFCNTASFSARVNAEALCGLTDWHLPSLQALVGIVDFSIHPSIDTTYFPTFNAIFLWNLYIKSEYGNGISLCIFLQWSDAAIAKK